MTEVFQKGIIQIKGHVENYKGIMLCTRPGENQKQETIRFIFKLI